MPHVEEAIQLPRDFECTFFPRENSMLLMLILFAGFGETSHDCQWPNGARIAVSFILNYEEGSERSWYDGD
jgi:hypothetical protein